MIIVFDATIGQTRYPIRLNRGASVELRVTVLDQDGVPIDLTGKTVTLTARAAPSAEEPLFAAKVFTAGKSDGCALFSFAASDTKNLEPGRYVYDVWVTDNVGGNQPAIELSELLVMAAAFHAPSS